MITWFFRVARALRNMLVAAIRDPIWAIICIVMAPFRAWNHVLWTLIAFAMTTVGMIIISLGIEHILAPHGRNVLLDNVLEVLTLVVVLGVVLRMITTPLLRHFDYGVQLWPILQDIHQLKAIYGQKAGTFLSNAGVLQVFGVNDHESARMVSDLLGQETVVFQTMARNLDSEQSGISYSQHHTGRPLMTADEVRTMPEHVELLFIAQQKPVAAVKLRYYADPEFKGLFDAA